MSPSQENVIIYTRPVMSSVFTQSSKILCTIQRSNLRFLGRPITSQHLFPPGFSHLFSANLTRVSKPYPCGSALLSRQMSAPDPFALAKHWNQQASLRCPGVPRPTESTSQRVYPLYVSSFHLHHYPPHRLHLCPRS